MPQFDSKRTRTHQERPYDSRNTPLGLVLDDRAVEIQLLTYIRSWLRMNWAE